MSRPALEVADLIRQHGARLRAQRGDTISYQQLRVLQALEICRTSRLGGHLEQCDNPACGHQRPAYDSCRNRHCPKCQTLDRARWVEARQKQLLPIPYFHLVFTLPHQLAPLIRANLTLCYNLLFAAAAEAIKTLAADPKHLGAQVGFFAILHTWGQQLSFHPHLHLVVTGGGLSPDGKQWVSAPLSKKGKHFFLPVKALSACFRRLYLEGLKTAFQQKKLLFTEPLEPETEEDAFARQIQSLQKLPWVVYAKPPFGSPSLVVEYLGRYTHRVAISNHRLLSLEEDRVCFRWRDYRHGNLEKTMTLEAIEFLRRFLLHVLPPGLVRIRHFGLLANCHVEQKIQSCRQLLQVQPATLLLPTPNQDWRSLFERLTGNPPDLCPQCQTGRLRPLYRLPRPDFARSPP
jgi:hypothetical protein